MNSAPAPTRAREASAAVNCHHLLGDVRRLNAAVGSHGLGDTKGDKAGAAREFEHMLTRLQRGQGQQTVLSGLELRRPRRLVVIDRAIPPVALNASLKLRVHNTDPQNSS